MLSTCRRVNVGANRQEDQENLMVHRLKDLFSQNNNLRLVNCQKMGIYIPKDFVLSRRFPVNLGYTI